MEKPATQVTVLICDSMLDSTTEKPIGLALTGAYWLYTYFLLKKQIKCKNNQMFALMVHFLDFHIKKVRVKDYT